MEAVGRQRSTEKRPGLGPERKRMHWQVPMDPTALRGGRRGAALSRKNCGPVRKWQEVNSLAGEETKHLHHLRNNGTDRASGGDVTPQAQCSERRTGNSRGTL
ncbi:hypothetical protein NDU88_003395 [Pleurodeles waltl]|uniref:Uncharacterized protein n=1 Tax=Pleurodeles waltl TaxID=8319 RepID=A0AAV7NHZ8_PLEWA|nr:hypothetical protein NDU88_003395 [Pleurodeles waltl]